MRKWVNWAPLAAASDPPRAQENLRATCGHLREPAASQKKDICSHLRAVQFIYVKRVVPVSATCVCELRVKALLISIEVCKTSWLSSYYSFFLDFLGVAAV